MVAERTATDAGRVRQRNLAAVLQLVHESRGVTRADLTRTLGLNRSTIGDLVGALVDAHWVDELDDAPRQGVGRPSPRVVPRDERVVVAVNPELDAVEVGLVALGGRVVARRRMPIDSPTVDQAVSIAALGIAQLAAEHPQSRIVGAGVAVPGLVRREDGLVRLAPHLGWREAPLGALLASAIEMPVEVANDAQLGCRAELAFGAGIGVRTLVYLNGGPSGIGGGIVMDGRPVAGRDGHAGEIGHMSADPDGPRCACGARGCLEVLVSRHALTAELGLEHPSDDELDAALGRAIHSEGTTGGAVSTEIARQMSWLAVAVRSVVNLLNPELVILGGHLAALWAAAPHETRETMLTGALGVSARSVRIEVAALGGSRLMVGAAELAWDARIADPLGAE